MQSIQSMQSIGFFVPVVYKNQNKTISQKVLEAVDEYFYFGSKSRVSIFAPDAEHPHCWALQNREDRYRSWTNIALKVASYSIIIPSLIALPILPLVALTTKYILRSYLHVSSIKMLSLSLPGSRMEARLPVDILKMVGSFLSYQDQGKLAQTAVFASDAARSTHQYYINLMTRFKAEIENLPAGPLARQDFQRLLVRLITCPAAGHPKHWVPVMDALMRHWVGELSTVADIILCDWRHVLRKESIRRKSHATLADLLATSEQPISSDQIYLFCRYLGKFLHKPPSFFYTLLFW